MNSVNTNDIPKALTQMLELKSTRDNVNFTAYQLAKAINVDRSLIQRLINGEVQNPRIDTLMKIADFFIKDGFPVTLDTLLNWQSKSFDVQDQVLVEDQPVDIALYHMHNFNGEKIGKTTVNIASKSAGLIGILTAQTVKPFFNAGSLFVVDMLKQPEHDNVVMVRLNQSPQLIIRKYIEKNNVLLEPLANDENEKPITYHTNNNQCQIIGVVVHINVKT